MSEHRDHWRAILDAVDQPVIVTNADGIIVEFNTAAEQLTGYLASEVLEHLPLAALYDSQQSAAHAAEGDSALRRKDGRRVAVSVTRRALRGALGMLEGCVVSLRELSAPTPVPAQVAGVPSAAARREAADGAALSEPCFAPSEVLRRLNGDSALLAEVVELFQGERFALAANIQRGVDERDPAAVQRSAHRLRSALLNLAGAPAARAALCLEETGRRGSLPHPKQVALLFAELERLSDALSRFRGESP